jgi:hypothetical protein
LSACRLVSLVGGLLGFVQSDRARWADRRSCSSLIATATVRELASNWELARADA